MKKTLEFSIILVSLILVISCTPLSPAGMAKEEETVHMKVGYISYISAHPLFIAQDRGIFSKHNLSVELVKFDSPIDVYNALLTSKIDSGLGSTLQYYSIEKTSPGRLIPVYVSINDVLLIVPINSTIKDIRDLDNKKVGVVLGGPGLALVQKIGEIEGIKMNTVGISSENQLITLMSGSVDALAITDPVATIGARKKLSKVIQSQIYAKYFVDPFPPALVTMSSDFESTHPLAAERFKQALDESIDYLRENRQEALALLPAHIPIEIDIALNLYPAEYWKSSEINSTLLGKQKDVFISLGLLD
ncbi:MAG: ABC transporter substrate-binding protein [Nanoarchaeota archaeon]|nr:ABC transporter substrate-binding protein [Nanoarchaeota archaeon]